MNNSDARFDRIEEILAGQGDRLDNQDQILDRILGIVQDHSGDLAAIKTDVREIRRDLSDLQKDFREHLLWPLGRAS